MKEETRNEALSDEALNEAAGGKHRPTRLWFWCDDCGMDVSMEVVHHPRCPICRGDNLSEAHLHAPFDC